MSYEHSSQKTFEKIFLKKNDKNLPDPGAISQVYIFWTCRIALQTLYLGTTPALAINWHKNSWIYGQQDWHYESVPNINETVRMLTTTRSEHFG